MGVIVKKLILVFVCCLYSQTTLFACSGVKIISSIARASKAEAASVALCLYRPVHKSLLNLEAEQKRIEQTKDSITIDLASALCRSHEKHHRVGLLFIVGQQQYSTKKELDAHITNYHVCARKSWKIFESLFATIDTFGRQRYATDDELKKELRCVLAEIKKHQPIHVELSPIELKSAHKCLKSDQK